VALIPLTRLMTGTFLGETAAIVPLTIAAAPFVAKVVADAIRDVNEGIVEASRAMGATRTQIVVKVLLPEARPAILAGLTAAGWRYYSPRQVGAWAHIRRNGRLTIGFVS
jgi:D-methionine transport system permease protein